MMNGGKCEKKIILTKPISLNKNDNYEAPNLFRRTLSIIKTLRPGTDLTNFQLPPMFNYPKSQLQVFGEFVYAVREDMLKKCNNGENPIERFIGVVGWSISTNRPIIYGVSPYNPILGETHHVSKGSLNLLVEQVEHHPPVFALHATDEKENIEILWSHNTVAKFCGNRVEGGLEGKKQLKLLNYGETYVMNAPKILMRFIPPESDWIGNVNIQCKETGLEADLCFSTNSIFGRKGSHSIKGKIFHSKSSSKTLYEVSGHWNSIVKVKDTNTGKETVIYNAKEILTGLKSPIVKDPQAIWESESGVVWSEVSEAIMSKNWDKAAEAKKAIEDKQRELKKERDSKGQIWLPKHFIVSKNNNGTWDSTPISKLVPPSPIVFPL